MGVPGRGTNHEKSYEEGAEPNLNNALSFLSSHFKVGIKLILMVYPTSSI